MRLRFAGARADALRVTGISASATVLAAALAACAGGGTTSSGRPLPGFPSSTAAPTTAPVPASKTAVSIRVVIPAPPATASNKRRSKYVSPATNSLSFAQDGALTTVVSLAAGSPNCSTGTGGTRTCTVNANATAGQNQSFTVKTFASANASGTPLSLQTVVATILPGTTNPLNVTLDGVVASLRAAFAVPSLPYEAPGSTKLTVDALDAAGDTIVGPGTYADAAGNAVKIALANGDATGSTALAQSTLAQPGAPVGFTYDGGPLATDTVTASAPGAGSARATIAFACAAPPAHEAMYVETDVTNPGYGQLSLAISGSPVPAASSVVDPPGILGAASSVDPAPLVDVAGRAYVIEGSLSSSSIPSALAEFCPQANGAAAIPYRSVVVPFPAASALDGSRDLYVLSLTTNTLSEFAPDSGTPGFAPSGAAATPPLRTITNAGTAAGGTGITTDYNGLPGLAAAAGNIYLSGYATISVFGPGKSGNASPSSSIADTSPGLVTPQSIATDTIGNVYVAYANFLDNTVSNSEELLIPLEAVAEYTPAGTLARRIAVGEDYAYRIAVDRVDNVWVSSLNVGGSVCDCSASYSVESFGPTATLHSSPTNHWIMTGTSVTGAPGFSTTVNTALVIQQIAVDPTNGNIYAADSNGFGVLVYTASGTLLGQILPSVGGLGAAYGIVFDQTGNFVVESGPYKAGGTTYGSAQLRWYPAGTGATGTTTPAPTKIVDLGSFAQPGPLAIDAAKNVYALGGGAVGGQSDSRTYTVAEFGANAGPNAAPVSTFLDRANVSVLPTLAGIALTPLGDVLVANAGSNEVYAYKAGTSGANAVPLSAYQDYAPSTYAAHALTTDAAGNLYAASFAGATITEFAAGTSKVLRSIAGPHTRLLDVTALAVDDAGNLYVGNQDGLTLDVFGPAQSGDVAPLRIAGDPLAESQDFLGFAVGPGSGAGTTASTRLSARSAMALERRTEARGRTATMVCAIMPSRCPGRIRHGGVVPLSSHRSRAN